LKPFITIPESVHALLSPSKAHMWLNCVGALAAAKEVPPKPSSKYAAEGTAYHDVARRALVEDKQCVDYVGDRYKVGVFEFTIDPDNAEEAQKYVDSIRAIPGKRMVEVDLEYSALLGLPKTYAVQETDGASTIQREYVVPVAAGTGDAVVIDYENKVIHSGDLKFGRGDIVYAKANPQLRLYGAAAVDRYELLGIEDDWKVAMAIYQPRANHFDSEIITVGELKAWVQAQRPAANRAYTLWASPHLLNPEIDLVPDEKQCRWCPLSGNCSAQNAKMLSQLPKGQAAAAIPTLAQLDDVQIAEALDMADEVENWLSAVRSEGLQRILQGHVLPNWKMVTGRRGNRSLPEDVDATRVKLDPAAALEIGLEEVGEDPVELPIKDAIHFALGDAAYKPRDLLTVAKLEKPLAKKAPLLWAALQGHITQADGKPGIARMEDPRPPLVNVGHEFPVAEASSAAAGLL
jgi:hypothetical protein